MMCPYGQGGRGVEPVRTVCDRERC